MDGLLQTSASPRNRSSISSAVSIQFPLLTKTGMEPSMPFTYLSLSMIKATLSADLTIPFCCMKEGCPLSVFPRPMTAASVPFGRLPRGCRPLSLLSPPHLHRSQTWLINPNNR
uniref:Uncharacterized protein n=1 Tax=Aegilops tauschii subsp. strangulata TaxID=200361 RepID=A0A453LYN9_AEGTS